ncbi:hypothetical protein ANCDUO_14246, partial [Ancylostoma duodenale]
MNCERSAGNLGSLKGRLDFVKKSDHRVGGLPVVRLTSRGVQSRTALVQRWSLRRITCPAYLIQLGVSGSVPDLRLFTKGGTPYSGHVMRRNDHRWTRAVSDWTPRH